MRHSARCVLFAAHAPNYWACRAPLLLSLTLLFGAFPSQAQPSGTFRNPVFTGQDPWVTKWNGSYYYSEAARDAIRVRQSATLTGLATATPRIIWSQSGPASDRLTNVWAPEVHFLDGRWYVYFSADH